MPATTSVSRNRIVYWLLTGCVLVIGLASRRFFVESSFIKAYVGDALWALMVFFGFAFVFNFWSTKKVMLAAFLLSFGIEISQLYHTPWLDSLRATRLGALVLGNTFVWSDFLCYSVGIIVGVLIEMYLMPAHFYRQRQKNTIQHTDHYSQK